MALTNATVDAGINAITATLVYASLHSAQPNGSGSNEISTGGYARKAAAFDASSGGVASLTGTLAFDGPANGAATHVGFWSAISSGTFLGYSALTGDQTFNAAGDYIVTEVTITGTPS